MLYAKNSQSHHRRSWIPASFRKFGREQDGVAAIEMSFLLLPFTFVVGIIFEITIQYFALSVMQNGMADLARQVRTNQINTGNFTLADARDAVCRPAFTMFDCDQMQIDVQEIASWTSPAVPRNPNGTVNPAGMGFNPGDRGSINIIRAYYNWPTILTGFLSYDFDTARQANIKVLVATEAFRIEPGSN